MCCCGTDGFWFQRLVVCNLLITFVNQTRLYMIGQRLTGTFWLMLTTVLCVNVSVRRGWWGGRWWGGRYTHINSMSYKCSTLTKTSQLSEHVINARLPPPPDPPPCCHLLSNPSESSVHSACDWPAGSITSGHSGDQLGWLTHLAGFQSSLLSPSPPLPPTPPFLADQYASQPTALQGRGSGAPRTLPTFITPARWAEN